MSKVCLVVPFSIATTVPTGFWGFLGNKGGVAIHLHIDETPVLFVCSHLAAHKQYEHTRNLEFHK